VVKQTDLYIQAHRGLRDKAIKSIVKHRTPLEHYIMHHPLFLTTLEPYQVNEDAPAIARAMAEASQTAGVGPMAAVAGALAEAVGRDLLAFSPEVIVENGGDVFLKTLKRRLVGVYAGQSPFTRKIALEVKPDETPLGICTSSATVGHSLSLGSADAVIALSPSAAFADAIATAIGNLVTETGDISKAIDIAKSIHQLRGIIVIKGERMGVWGRVKLASSS
jgi:ApbE superfamily uncharacterized protein (UPF0280 family)